MSAVLPICVLGERKGQRPRAKDEGILSFFWFCLVNWEVILLARLCYVTTLNCQGA